jgi:glycosyltransferase involved in cell wall biosynthesis
LKISIITPVLNCEKYLQIAIDSVIAQNYSSFEHIVVDGGSTDRTVAILKSNPHIRWISGPDGGAWAALRKGLQMATGDIVCLLMGNDFFMPNAFDAIINVFKQNSDCEWVAGHCNIVDNTGREIRKFITRYKRFLLNRHSFFLLLIENYLSIHAVFFKKDLLRQIGEYDVDTASEYDLWIRFAEKCKLCVVNCMVASFRIHLGSATSSFNDFNAKLAFLTVKKRYLRTHPIAVGLHYLNYLKIIFCYSILNRLVKK